jgi:periplasmic divalent cation tolerance protein
MADFMQVVTTVDSEEAAEQVVGPIKSIYWRQGELEEVREWQLIIKTMTVRKDELEAYIKENHSYDTPEITATVISGGSDEYLDWITAETRIDASS